MEAKASVSARLSLSFLWPECSAGSLPSVLGTSFRPTSLVSWDLSSRLHQDAPAGPRKAAQPRPKSASVPKWYVQVSVLKLI